MALLWFLLGLLSGVIITSVICCLQIKQGVLKIDHSNPEKDIYRLDIDDLDCLTKKKRLILKIDNNADLSQK